MNRINRYFAFVVIVLAIALVATLFVGYDRGKPIVAMFDSPTHEAGAARAISNTSPASFAERFYFGA